jgi:glycosyltransferase involved in cell wall biosynthesis
MSPSAVVVVSSTRRRGAEVFGEQLVTGLNQTGWRSDLLALIKGPEGPEVAAISLSEAGQRVARLDLRILMRLRRQILASRPDVVLANGSATLKYTALALIGLSNKPSFLYGSVGEPRYWARGFLRRGVQRFFLSRTDLILAVSKTTAQQLIDDLRQPESRVKVAETGVSPALMRIESLAAREILHVLVLGSLSHEKNPVAAVDVFAHALGNGRGTLRFVGAGPLFDQVVEASRAAGIGASAEFTGAISDVTETLAWADVLLLTSRTEGLPGAVLEAGAAGVPAVGFDVGGVAEAIINGISGFVVPAGDIKAAAVALGRLADNPELRTRLGVGARQHVRQHFLLPDAIERYRSALEAAVKAAKS